MPYGLSAAYLAVWVETSVFVVQSKRGCFLDMGAATVACTQRNLPIFQAESGFTGCALVQ